MADLKISQLTAATVPLAGTEVLPLVQSSTTKKVGAADLLAGVTVSAGFSASITGGGTVYLGSSNSYGNLAVVKNQVGTTKVGVSNNDGTANSGSYFSSYYGTTEIGAFGHYWDGGAFINRIKYFGKQEFAEGTTVRVRFEQTSGNITAVTGNFVQGTTAKGVNFTANTPAAGMTSQLLNWYEEGTWTPVLKFGGATTGITYTTQSGTYTRIGRMVHARATIVLSSNGSASGGALITGLPYTVAVTTAASIYQEGISYTGSLNVAVEGTVDRFTIQQVSEAGVNSNLDRTNFSNTASFTLTVCYQV